jgi:hypothetical protein
MGGSSASNGRDVSMSSDLPDAERGDPPRFMALKRTTLAAATAFLAINIWTGAPLLALWAGSQVEGETALTMRALVVVVVVLVALVTAMTLALTWLSNTYDELIGRPRGERRAPWLRSMRAEAEIEIDGRVGITALERIVMMSVYIAVIALLVWLLFFAGSMVPSQLRG